jgi:hypothetical protein
MNSIDFLEHGGGAAGRPLVLRHLDYEMPLVDPRELGYQEVLMCLHLGLAPGTPAELPWWKAEMVFGRWCACWDLPSFESARRLAYVVDHYREALIHDLLVHASLDLGELWRARRWSTLLDVIDRLPGHSHYFAAVANDEEHARLVAEAHAQSGKRQERSPDDGPALVTFTPEVAALYEVVDAINQVRYAVVAVQAGKKAGDPPKRLTRPTTALEKAMRRAEFERRKAAHESLVARVLPHKKQPV